MPGKFNGWNITYDRAEYFRQAKEAEKYANMTLEEIEAEIEKLDSKNDTKDR